MKSQAKPENRPQLDAAIRHLESVHRVVVAKRNGAKVIPFPTREAGRVPA